MMRMLMLMMMLMIMLLMMLMMMLLMMIMLMIMMMLLKCEVDVVLDHAAKALVLSLAWYSTDQEGGDVAALLELVWRDAPMPVEKVFSKNPNGRQRGSKRRLDLFAVAVFQNAHYTAF